MTETTRESLNEALSAAVDGEAEELELRRVLNAVERDPELRAKWERLHLIGDAMRGGAMRLGDTGVNGLVEPAMTGVDEAVADEPPRGRWLTGVAAAAAVVIAVTFVAVQDRESADQQPLVAQSSTTVVAEPLSEEDLRLQRDYLIYHAHRSSVANRSPAMPFIKALAVPSGSEEGQ
ncbi:MAG: sigma-E factor negative regulatory protein [Gammaproteobacteria bacterium]|nr:sigma-E factor negative regulatory protein [Gammaproteobacteria bacterium]MXY57500.1 sigma-E factor negative regulatory protein [Gammaproteobacteria bacterium]MYF29759.1 sigma-E factor negative regulatory protein [Gammaproteobacteria bacterium]MYK45964.1 sigma-E factor negative regulatory protein [Gammaproteobacteria bacterium]